MMQKKIIEGVRMMKYEVKEKVINDELKYGLVDEQFNEILPFQYDQVIENDDVLILKRNGQPDEVFENGKLIVKEEDCYYDIEHVMGSYFKVGRKNEDSSLEYGIIYACPFSGIRIAYPFGKANEMVVDNGRVLLYNHKKTKTEKGIWGDIEVGHLDPIYDSFYKESIELNYPVLPDASKIFGDANATWHYGCFENTMKLLWTSRMVKGKEEISVRLHGKELLNANKITFNKDCQFFILEKNESGKKIFELVPATYLWKLSCLGTSVDGHLTMTFPFSIDLEIEDYEFIPETDYVKVKVGGKWGVLEVIFYQEQVEANIRYSKDTSLKEGYSTVLDFQYENKEDIQYSGNNLIHSFILKDGDQKKLVGFYSGYRYNSHYDQCYIVPNRYLDIQKLSDGYQLQREDGRYQYGKLYRNLVDQRYRYFECEFQTTEDSYSELISCDSYGRPLVGGKVLLGVKEVVDGVKLFDMISTESTSVLASNLVDFHPIDSFHQFRQCLDIDGNTMLFDPYFHLLLKEAEVKSYEYDDVLRYFIVTHHDDTKSIVPSRNMNPKVREQMEDLFGTYSNVFTRGPIILTEQKIGPDKSFVSESRIEGENGDHSIRSKRKLFEGIVVDAKVYENATILTVFDPEQEKNVVGGIENITGTICFPFEYDSIEHWTDRFLGKSGESYTWYDEDHFKSIDSHSHPVKVKNSKES